MPTNGSQKDELTSNQERLIAFLVIALFGLMYWFFMHGNKPTLDLNNVEADPVGTKTVIDRNEFNHEQVAKNTKKEEVQTRRDEEFALAQNKQKEALRLLEIEQIKAEQQNSIDAEVEKIKAAYEEKITELEQSLEKQERLNSEKTARIETLAKVGKMEAEQITQQLQESKKVAEAERLKVEQTAQKLIEVETQKAKQEVFETYNNADLNATIEAERLKAEEAEKALREAQQEAATEKQKLEEAKKLADAERLKVEEAQKLAEEEKRKAEETARQLAETKRLAEEERLKAEETAMKLADLKALKEKQAALDAENAARLAANIEAKRVKAEQVAEAERSKLEALQQQKQLQDEQNAAKAAQLAASIEAEKAKAEKIAQKLLESKQKIEEERLKTESASQKIAALEKLKSTAEAQQLIEKKERELAEVERLKAETELAEIKRIKEEEEALALAKEQEELNLRIKIAREALEQQEQERLSTSLNSEDFDQNTDSNFENELIGLLNDKTINKALAFDRVLFTPGSAVLNNQSISQIETASRILKNQGFKKILLRGHTDNTGNEKQNMALSLSRSMNIKKMLISLGISPEKISVEGVGSQEPVADNSTVAGRKVNRRIDLLLLDN